MLARQGAYGLGNRALYLKAQRDGKTLKTKQLYQYDQYIQTGLRTLRGCPENQYLCAAPVFCTHVCYDGAYCLDTYTCTSGVWEPYEAVVWCAWAAYATLSLFGIYHTLRMLPIMLFMVFTKYSGWWWLPISLVENGYTQGLSC